ncbi:DUF2971 domain-containing protein [Pseudomonas fluorescens]|uniref:DUF2971 domain-containing protein n=1 Tax=Pseudomonas fluorescens TaxID=294 RepID=A0A7Z3GZS9_PSEFL|nr:DUF2971 domain-containing protein [Pseudomonas fluorescens]QJP95457.1 hypothetical protein C6Y56_12950 [Pseudomonas fluorescens]
MQLFHYTDINAVKSILENEKLWLTDVRFLNDSEELHNGIHALIDYIKHQVKTFPDRHELLGVAAEYVEAGLVGKAGYGIENRPVFICSFSQAGDLLSQWRAYGSYAIEFSSEAIPHALSACVYDDFEKLSQASTVALASLMTISDSMLKNDGYLDSDGYEAFSNLVGLAATFKHQSFSEEQEVRIVAGHDLDPEIEDGLEVSFRTRGNMLIPFVELSAPSKSIRAIHIGPMADQELAYISLKSFVTKLNLDRFTKDNNYLHDIDIIKSSIPYRAP